MRIRRRKFRKCSICNAEVYAKSMCKYHYYRELNKRTKQKKRKPIRKVSKKRAPSNYMYKKLRKEFFSLEENQVCKVQVEGVCTFHATDVHHRAGRIGELLTNTAWWLPVCRSCHQHIHKHSQWAEENQFIVHL